MKASEMVSTRNVGPVGEKRMTCSSNSVSFLRTLESDVYAHPSKTQSLQHSSKLATSFVEAVMRPQWSVTPTSQTHQQHKLSKTKEECVNVKITAVRACHLNLFVTWQNVLITGLQVRPQKWCFA